MKTTLLLLVAVTIAFRVNAECAGTYKNNHSYYSEGSGGTSVYSLRDTYGGGEWCCYFNDDHKLKFTIKSVIINGFLGADITCYKGGVGFDYIKYYIKGPNGKGKTIDIYVDWTETPRTVSKDAGGCFWKYCGWGKR